MPALFAFLAPLLAWFARHLVVKVLALLGIGVVSYSIISYFFDKYVNAGLASLGGLPQDLAFLIGISKLDQCISIVLGSLFIRAAIVSFKAVVSKI